MGRVLSDQEIEALLSEPKPVPADWRQRLRPRVKSNQVFRQADLEAKGTQGHLFRVILRTNDLNALDFSLILKFVDTDGTEYTLTRFNGKHPSQHTNKWEKSKGSPGAAFRNRFHIHRATERYQVAGLDATGYAEPTDLYGSFASALEKFSEHICMRAEETGPTLWEKKEDQA